MGIGEKMERAEWLAVRNKAVIVGIVFHVSTGAVDMLPQAPGPRVIFTRCLGHGNKQQWDKTSACFAGALHCHDRGEYFHSC